MSTVDSVATTVLNLADCAEVPAERIGGKALGLGRLLALDVDVPPGFVVTTELFARWMRSHGLDEAVRLRLAQAADAASLRAAASGIAELISSHPLESAEIDALYAEMPGGLESAVAVRSSATGEDSEETSYAGQQETFLWVRGAEAVRRRIVDCWASLFSVEAVEYRRNMGLAPEGSEMAVVVQQMVPAEVAGVMFTIDPLTGDPSQITIESTFGLGLPLVSGEVTPDRYCVDKVTLELRSQTIVHKPFAEQLDPELDTTHRVALSDEQATTSSLTESEAVALAQIGKRLERAFGGPTDIEFALGLGSGSARHIYLLQARPETGQRARRQEPAAAGASADKGRGAAFGQMLVGLRRSSTNTQGDARETQ
jgi:phosphoenolpyruvate synthase/pyruvate phosphate dikinase